jgi:tetratricopeptide (TPR) repeat protein
MRRSTIRLKGSVGYNKRSLAYIRKGLYDQTISDHSKALEIDPISMDAYFFRGYAYEKRSP